MSAPKAASAASPLLGTVLPSEYQPGVSYRLERLLGQGGTATAYLATRFAPGGEGPAVIKVILPRLVASSGATAETIIKKEAVALGRLNERLPPTPSVVRLLDVGALEYEYLTGALRLPWLALEYVHGGPEGATLYDRVDYAIEHTGYAFDPARAARAVRSLSDGLSEIHEVGVLHRDLTPGNVLCCGSTDSELFKISDFGIARPQGLSATFGAVTLGTPGYVAPEQLMPQDAAVGPHSDIFSLAAVIYFLLTGQHYFNPRSPMDAYASTKSALRRSIAEVPTLCPELREQPVVCQAIDEALARATSLDVRLRPASPKLLAASVMPWLGDAAQSAYPSRRWLSSIQKLDAPEPGTVGAHWLVRHPPGEDRLVVSAAWNAAGHCLAVTTRGLSYWDGTHWAAAPTQGLPHPSSIRFARRMSPVSWLLGSDGALLSEYSRDGARELRRGPDEAVSFVDATPEVEDVSVVLGERMGYPPLLHTLVGRRWLKPFVLTQARRVTGLCRVDDEQWLVVGRGNEGRAFAALYRPLRWELEPLPAPRGRALLSSSSRPERHLAVAVGAEGSVLEVTRDRAQARVLPGEPDLATVAIDPLGRQWAGGSGRIWVRRFQGDWSCVWEDPEFRSPFVSIMAEVGFVAAMTVDGGVVECRSQAAGAA